LAATVKVLYNSDSLEQVRIASLLETLGTLAQPFAKLEGFQPLLTYAQEQAHSALGHTQVEDASARIQQATAQVAQSLGVDLPTYREERASEEPESNTQQPNRLTPINVFISYSHVDELLLRQLETHLALLRQQGLITTWHNRQILPGIDWSSEIDIHLEQSALILLLISADFVASDYVSGIEMKRALERHKAGEARVVPIILRPVHWEGAPFSKIQALPSDTKPISRWLDHDDAFADIVKSLRKVINELNALQHYNEAIRDFDQAIQLNPINATAYFERGNALYNLKRYEEALQAFDQAIQLDPVNATAYFNRGNVLYNIKLYEEALQTYERARSLQPKDVNILFTLSHLYNDTGAYEQAIEILDQLIESQPEFADAYKQRGLAYRRWADVKYAATGDEERRADEYKRAIADYERAVELRPDFEDALGSLGGLYRRMGDYEQAAKYYQRLYEVNPSSSYGLGNLASLSWYLGNIEDARKYFNLLEEAAQGRIKEDEDEEAVQRHTQDNEPYWNYYDLALGQLATQELEAARETYAKAIEKTPTVVQLDAVLSNLYFLQGAREHIEGLEEIIAMLENAKDVKEE
jgi:tetratricopeptide (TPR) repeat protein